MHSPDHRISQHRRIQPFTPQRRPIGYMDSAQKADRACSSLILSTTPTSFISAFISPVLGVFGEQPKRGSQTSRGGTWHCRKQRPPIGQASIRLIEHLASSNSPERLYRSPSACLRTGLICLLSPKEPSRVAEPVCAYPSHPSHA